YHPSESFCWWGTNTRSLADSELRGRFNQKALSRITLARMLGNDNNGAAEPSNNLSSRWSNFRETYCDPHDNGWRNTTGDNGLQSICRTGDLARANNDVDYTRMIEYPRTLEVNFHPALKSPAGGGGQP